MNIIVSQMFVQQLVQANNKEDTKNLFIIGPLGREPTGHRWILVLSLEILVVSEFDKVAGTATNYLQYYYM